jgi:hypothetical protein
VKLIVYGVVLLLLASCASSQSVKRAKAEALWCAMPAEAQARAVSELGATPQDCTAVTVTGATND